MSQSRFLHQGPLHPPAVPFAQGSKSNHQIETPGAMKFIRYTKRPRQLSQTNIPRITVQQLRTEKRQRRHALLNRRKQKHFKLSKLHAYHRSVARFLHSRRPPNAGGGPNPQVDGMWQRYIHELITLGWTSRARREFELFHKYCTDGISSTECHKWCTFDRFRQTKIRNKRCFHCYDDHLAPEGDYDSDISETSSAGWYDVPASAEEMQRVLNKPLYTLIYNCLYEEGLKNEKQWALLSTADKRARTKEFLAQVKGLEHVEGAEYVEGDYRRLRDLLYQTNGIADPRVIDTQIFIFHKLLSVGQPNIAHRLLINLDWFYTRAAKNDKKDEGLQGCLETVACTLNYHRDVAEYSYDDNERERREELRWRETEWDDFTGESENSDVAEQDEADQWKSENSAKAEQDEWETEEEGVELVTKQETSKYSEGVKGWVLNKLARVYNFVFD